MAGLFIDKYQKIYQLHSHFGISMLQTKQLLILNTLGAFYFNAFSLIAPVS